MSNEKTDISSVCVFTGSSFGNQPAYTPAACELGRTIAECGMRLVYGGAAVGLMGQVADAALDAGGEVVGVLPEKLAKLELAHPKLTELHVVDSMHARKRRMSELSDCFIALPGGIGTLEETFEVWTWTQLGIHAKPIGLMNVSGFYDTLITFLDQLVREGFVTEANRSLACVEEDPVALLGALKRIDTSYTSKWIDPLPA